MFNVTLWLRALVVVACMLVGALPARSDPTYQLIDLGVMSSWPNAWSFARGLNNTGQVTGKGQAPDGAIHAFLYTDGVMHDLGHLGGGWSQDIGEAVNESGHIAGYSDYGDDGQGAFLYRGPGDVEFLGTLGGNFSWAEDVNDFDQVVGRASIDGFDTHAFIWQDGVMTDLGTLGGDFSNANAVNNVGQVVGRSDSDPDEHYVLYQAFIWEAGVMTRIGDEYQGGNARDINDLGQVCGTASFAGWPYPYRWSEEEGMVPLPTLGWWENDTYAINNAGDIVGYAQTGSGSSSYRAALWTDGEIINLSDLMADTGWTLTQAYDINDQGWIVGRGVTPENKVHGFMLVPEPSSIAMLAIGFAAACHVARLRRPR
jgi:probable HAF family extracellular repeat protein